MKKEIELFENKFKVYNICNHNFIYVNKNIIVQIKIEAGRV